MNAAVRNLLVKIFLLSIIAKLMAFSTDSANNLGESKENFTYLVKGGYRPSNPAFSKHVVSVQLNAKSEFFGEYHFCCGTIIKAHLILSAAHCFAMRKKLKPVEVKIVAGAPNRLEHTSNTQIVNVKEIMVHPKYTRLDMKRDIALLILAKKLIENGEYVQSVPMAEYRPSTGDKCTVVGWGTIFYRGPMPAELVYGGDLVVWDRKKCSSKISMRGQSMICVKHDFDYEVDACQGDSGGPLFCDSKVAGIVSFGDGCGEKGAPGVYTDVAYYKDWIESNVCYIKSNFKLIAVLISIKFLCKI